MVCEHVFIYKDHTEQSLERIRNPALRAAKGHAVVLGYWDGARGFRTDPTPQTAALLRQTLPCLEREGP